MQTPQVYTHTRARACELGKAKTLPNIVLLDPPRLIFARPRLGPRLRVHG